MSALRQADAESKAAKFLANKNWGARRTQGFVVCVANLAK